jgi:hypothetical protein
MPTDNEEVYGIPAAFRLYPLMSSKRQKQKEDPN